MKAIVKTMVLPAFLILSQSAFAMDSTSTSSSMCGSRMNEMVSSLKLDDAQQTKIKAIKDEMKSSMQSSWNQMSTLRTQISQQAQSDHMDKSKLNSLIDQQTQLIGNTMKAKTMAENQIFSVLTPEQRMQYSQMMKQREDSIRTMFEKCDD